VTFGRLQARAAELDAPLAADQLAQFALYRERLLEWNQRVNLTAVRDAEQVEERHFVDSLNCLLVLPAAQSSAPALRLLDVGSGGGFPGLPLKLARPDLRLTLLDSVRKKTRFLESVVAELGLVGVEVLTGRAEDLARAVEYRERFDLVVARALAPLPVLLELCLPFLQIGGRLIAPRRGDLLAEQEAAEQAARLLGAEFRAPIIVGIGERGGQDGLTIAGKIGSTPDRYPRRAGMPAKRPLGMSAPTET
jgi:16S rRNA (guanine527-N7)-methyltransferase